jgi:hypothetical protein
LLFIEKATPKYIETAFNVSLANPFFIFGGFLCFITTQKIAIKEK